MASRGAWCWAVLRGVRATGAILVDITRVLHEATAITAAPSSVSLVRLAAWTSRLGNITDEVQSLTRDRGPAATADVPGSGPLHGGKVA